MITIPLRSPGAIAASRNIQGILEDMWISEFFNSELGQEFTRADNTTNIPGLGLVAVGGFSYSDPATQFQKYYIPAGARAVLDLSNLYILDVIPVLQ